MPSRTDADAAFDALLAFVKKHPDANFRAAADAVTAVGHRVFPIQFSRAKAAIASKALRTKSGAAATKKGAKVAKVPRRAQKKVKLIVRDAADLALWFEIVARINGASAAPGPRAELTGNGERWLLVVN